MTMTNTFHPYREVDATGKCHACSGNAWQDGHGMSTDPAGVNCITAPDLQATCKSPGIQNVPSDPTHKSILMAAEEIVHGPRRKAYGHPTANHQRIADLWNGFLNGRADRNADLTPTEVVLLMLLLKIARLQETPQHVDSWQDLAGYAACGAIIEGIDPP